uniref:NADH-ubiquinone oxidoreductase chain 4 n=1 Tax=Xibalbanus tulumensis TaxID=1519145 RepID=Q6SKY4_XIBTU|nr:NADH dehydrogenase subunit 4 [Xibalbanus tulumensis]AAS00889.1 NADH dehydrogenase subunit 4 [Xibalbanus tulumensis]
MVLLKYIVCLLFLLVCGSSSWFIAQGVLGIIFFLMIGGVLYLDYNVGVGYLFGCDIMGFSLVLLSIWISMLMVMASWEIYSSGKFCSLFLFLVLLLCIILVLCFSTINMLLFYIFFESSIIPILLIISGFGYQPERLQASIYLLMYMVFSSFPLLLGIMGLYSYNMVFQSFTIYLPIGDDVLSVIWSFSLVFAFLVSVPMYVVHVWLPSAHVEAPVSGSMILAGVLLKLGGYGMFRFMIYFECFMLSNLLMSVSLIGGVAVGLVCLRQVDVKCLIAYSSVVHMGVLLGGMFTFKHWGHLGSLLLMIGHGLCSSGLFCLANIVYSRLGSRSMLLSKGVITFMPSMCLWWFMFSILNMSAPPGLSLFGELGLLMSMISWSWIVGCLLFFVLLFSASYSLYMFISLQHGNLGSLNYGGGSGYVSEFLLMFLHWFPLTFMFLLMDVVLL